MSRSVVIVDRFAGLDFPDGIVAWSTLRSLANSVGADIYKRPVITIGFTAWPRKIGGRLAPRNCEPAVVFTD